MNEKVICVGFHKTGTTSIGEALSILDYKNCFGANELRASLGEKELMIDLFNKDYNKIIDFAEHFDAFNDLPWFKIYKIMDKAFPNSKFILTKREELDWLKSTQNYFKNSISPFRLWLYGPNVGSDQKYLEKYRKHNDEILSYFSKRDSDLLILDITSDNKWKKLCDFLNKPEPPVSFPYLNVHSK